MPWAAEDGWEVGELRGRMQRLRGLRERLHLDALVLFSRSSIRYFTGMRTNTASGSVLAVGSGGEVVWVVPVLDYRLMQGECWLAAPEEGAIVSFPEDTPDYLSVLGKHLGPGMRRVGLDKGAVTGSQLDMLFALWPEMEPVGVDGGLLALRAVKSATEIGAIRQAAAMADTAMQEALKLLRPGVRERDISDRALQVMNDLGAEGPSFEPFAMSGPNSSLPRRYSSSRQIVAGEPVIFDMGVRHRGYCSDLTRTFWLGKLPGQMWEVFQVAELAQRRAVEAVRPGARRAEVDEAARRIIREAGYGEYFPHLTGHGVGLDVHEDPIVDRGVEGTLEPGMVLTIEPGVYLPGVGGARVEDMVLVTADGHEVLTPTPRLIVPPGGNGGL
ncbi:MAG TPA: aminopeptidase P family protein [Firmicutes bacterium]|nr:aminopeptidase P family protein [Bacillota bacterium]